MKKYLIINVDDFGLCESVNKAVFELYENKKISSATIMTTAPGFKTAAEWVVKNNIKDIGLHLTFTSEWDNFKYKSLTGGKSIDKNGYFPKSIDNCNYKDINNEILEQYNKATDSGIKLSHIDVHMYSIYGIVDKRLGLSGVIKLAKEKGHLPIRMCRYIYNDSGIIPNLYKRSKTDIFKLYSYLCDYNKINIPDYVFAYPFDNEYKMKYEEMKNALSNLLLNLPYGVSEIHLHPAVEGEDLKSFNKNWGRRVDEYRLLNDKDIEKLIIDNDINLITYRDLKDIQDDKSKIIALKNIIGYSFKLPFKCLFNI